MNANAKKRYKDIDLPFTCPITGREFNSTKGLSVYVTKTLKMDREEYYNKYVHHRETKCFFCGKEGEFISIGKGYRNLCNDPECIKKSFSSHSIEGFMYRENLTYEEAEIRFKVENERQLSERMKTFDKLRSENPSFDRERSHDCVEFWIKRGFTEGDAKLEVDKVLLNMREKTSEILKSDPLKYASKYPTKIEYYLKRGFTEKEGRAKISKIQNRFSLDGCIEKYGEKDGTEVWHDRQTKWLAVLDNKSDEEKLKINKKKLSGCRYSIVSQILFWDIYKIENINYENIKNDRIRFKELNDEFFLYTTIKKLVSYDYTDMDKKKCIEFNGDFWHCNPTKYDENWIHRVRNIQSKEIWEFDRFKIDEMKKNGYEVFVVWESDYRSNPKQTLEKCIEFLNK